MATVAGTVTNDSIDNLPSGGPVARAIDRWIYVYMAASFLVITLAGFVPDAIRQVAGIKAGARPPFPLIVHVHAVLMASFPLLLLAQTTLMATGRRELHQQLGRVALVLVPAIVLVSFIVFPVWYHSFWNAAHSGPPQFRANLQQAVFFFDDIVLWQIRIAILFPLFIMLALRARRTNPGLHKRMMFLATALPVQAAIARIDWIPSTLPASALSTDLYTLVILSPMFIWDLIRTRTVHRAYLIWIAVCLPFSVALNLLWGTPWWHATAHRLMGV